MKFKFKNKYTEKELAIIGLFSLRASVSIPEMIDAVNKVSAKPVSRQAIASQIRLMASKLAMDGYVMKRTSGIGRGAVGVFVLTTVNGGK